MDLPNLYRTPIEPDLSDPAGFQANAVRLNPPTGELAVKLIEIPPGNHLCPYHYEYVEEWLLVLSGEADVRTPDGIRRHPAGAAVCFPAGPEGAHRVSSPPGASEPTRVVMFSPRANPELCVYPDSDKLAVYTRDGNDEVFVRRSEPSSHLDYWDGETP